MADYIETYVLGQNFTFETIWMTDMAVPGVGWMGDPPEDPSIARDWDDTAPDDTLPYPLTWVVMLDEEPTANFGHDVLWIYVSETPAGALDAHAVVNKDYYPTVFAGNGTELSFGCKEVTPLGCPVGPLDSLDPEDEAFVAAAEEAAAAAEDKDCLYAVLISGFGSSDLRRERRYQRNLKSVYKKLRDCGYPEDQIFTFLEDGSSLDLDGDGDNDVNGTATKMMVSDKIKNLCKNLVEDRDVLFIYTTGHGKSDGALKLWGRDSYTPTEFANDTKDCKVCRLFVVMSQCFSGAFLEPATDNDHKNAVVHTATDSANPSQCRIYMDHWEDEDPKTKTINQIQAAVKVDMAADQKVCIGGQDHCEPCDDITQCDNALTCQLPTWKGVPHKTTPQAKEGTPKNGDTSLCTCWTTPFPTTPPDTLSPTQVPTVLPTKAPSPGGFGEPHFKTWRGRRFDYHGECDLVLLRSPTFAAGKGIELIIRTQIAHPRAYSYIASAVLKIGNDVLQVDGYGVYYFNGKQSAELPDNIAGFPLTYTQTEKKRHIFDLNLHDHHHHHIVLREFKGFISVNVDEVGEYFQDCTGLLGSFETGDMLARDSQTIMADPVTYGQEWQVLDTEPMLFQTARFPQYPARCLMADPAQVARRRLAETSISDAEAEEACAHLAKEDRADCVFDVMETGDLEMAVEDALNGSDLEMVKEAAIF